MNIRMNVTSKMSEQKLEAVVDNGLIEACKDGNTAAVLTLIRAGQDPNVMMTVDDDNVTALMLAAERGDETMVQCLLEAGADWQAQDTTGHTAGEYAMGNTRDGNVFKLLLEWAVQCEMILGRESLKSREEQGDAPINSEYLESTIQYDGDNLIDDSTGDAVMMTWETPLMVHHAKDVCWNRGDVVNIGFGMGIVDTEIQKHSPKSHTIIEAHPDVYKQMIRKGWGSKPGVRVVFGRWQDVIDDLGPFDGIFFDTYGEYYEDMQMLHTRLPKLLKPHGVYSFFNGLAPDNIFFHMVSGEVARRELNELGLEVSYYPVSVDSTQQKESWDDTWKGISSRYWKFPTYFVPKCILPP
jgi:protein arginine N-methyltransferase 2